MAQPISKINWPSKKYILSDLDGTLIDSIGAWAKADSDLLLEFCNLNVPPPEAHRDTITFVKHYEGSGNLLYVSHANMLIEKYHIKGISALELCIWRQNRANEILLTISYKDGAIQFLKTAKNQGFKLGLITTTPKKQLDTYRYENQHMTAQCIIDELFDIIIDADSVTKSKPNPEPYQIAISKLGGLPSEYIAFEDSLDGVQSAKSANIEVVRVHDEYSVSQRPAINALADYYLDDWRDLLSQPLL